MIMLGAQQLNLNYKLTPIYSNKIQQIADSKVSFQHFDTPGWTSVMHTQTTSEPPIKPSLHHRILDRLSKMDGIQLSDSQLRNVRTPQSQQDLEKVVMKGRSIKTQTVFEKENRSNRKNTDRLARPKRSASQHSLSNQQSRVSAGSMSSGRQGISGVILKNGSKHSTRPQTKRFHHITVHQHLYLDGVKQLKKRTIERILDHQYQMKNIAPFKPKINARSGQLAEMHYSRLKAKQEIEDQLSTEFEQTQHTSQNQPYKQTAQESQYRALYELFLLLSQSGDVFTLTSAKAVMEELPLMCIKALDRIIEKLYQGESFSWLQFIAAINDKKIVSQKKGLLRVVEKWMSHKKRSSAAQTAHDSKQ